MFLVVCAAVTAVAAAANQTAFTESNLSSTFRPLCQLNPGVRKAVCEVSSPSGPRVAECQQHCLATDGCIGFEYGVDHGGSNTNYPAGSCFPQDSVDTTGCDGVMMNLDVYVLDSPVR